MVGDVDGCVMGVGRWGKEGVGDREEEVEKRKKQDTAKMLKRAQL